MAKTILIVEDNALNLRFFNDLLQAHGFDTVQARDGETALDLVRAGRPDLVLLDMRLPGMSGFDVAQRLKADGALRSVPILAVTALATPEDETQSRAAGCDAYLRKPVGMDMLLETIEKMTAT